MKIDEPKTPYVTDEEFRKLCEEDEEYQKEFGDRSEGSDMDVDMKIAKDVIDMKSIEANNDSAMDCMSGGDGVDIGRINAGLSNQ
jgi:hypothetical protein